MNNNIDLTKILKDCPKGWKLYTPIFGEVEFSSIEKDCTYPIILSVQEGGSATFTGLVKFTKEGCFFTESTDVECLLFPSKEQRDWSKFTASWYKKEKFDSKTLKPFDKVLVRDKSCYNWMCELFSYIKTESEFKYWCISNCYKYCIPYNDDTKHLVGTTEEAPKFYRYWED